MTMDLLRFATAGSVDDGKSTLVGRLLYDSKSIFEDQLDAVERASVARGGERVDLALLTDGLRAEREQGITIDVAYRYFATPRRKFIIADTPGHLQYTRNMVTGASTADLAIVLVDATKGVLEQSRRHALLLSLLGVPHIVVCVNKMDLAGYSQAVFERIKQEFTAFAARLAVPDLTFVPVSALNGDNVVTRSAEMPWHEGGSLLHLLETAHIASDRNLVDLRFPVQYVIRSGEGRGYAGRLAGGTVRPGDEVLHLPSGLTTRVTAVESPGGPVDEAFAPMSVSLRLADDLDISRGDMLCRPRNVPAVTQDLDLMVCWMGDRPMLPRTTVTVKHTTRTARAMVGDLRYRLDIDTLHRDPDATRLHRNEIGRVGLRVTSPLFCDPYTRNRLTGGVILIDDATNSTVAAGMITGFAGTE
jgi:bifunctional enzyme CysN/CysC